MRSYNDINGKYQGGDLYLNDCNLSSLATMPSEIIGSVECEYNKLTNLVGGPQHVTGDYRCGNNQLTDLVGCASHIGGRMVFWNNNITSLVGIHKIIKSCSSIRFDSNKITQGGIGLLLIENLTSMTTDYLPFVIIESYLGKGTKGMMACRSELIEKGYENHAKL